MLKFPPLTSAQKLILTGLTALAVLFGLVVRINGLGVWPLSVDEYYLTKSVLSILENGIPGFECAYKNLCDAASGWESIADCYAQEEPYHPFEIKG